MITPMVVDYRTKAEAFWFWFWFWGGMDFVVGISGWVDERDCTGGVVRTVVVSLFEPRSRTQVSGCGSMPYRNVKLVER